MQSFKTIQVAVKSFLTLLFIAVFQTVLLAQDDKKVDINVNTNSGGNWYNHPWVWVVGGAVFLLLLVALLRGNNNKG